MRFWQGWDGDPLVDEVRARIRERDWKQAARSALVLLRYNPLRVALLNEQGMQRHIQARERRIEELRRRLARERRGVQWLRKQNQRSTPQTQNPTPELRSEEGSKQRLQSPPVGEVSFGSFRRVKPISGQFGFDRGRPIDRYYIENFLARHADDIQGRVLEIMNDSYTRKYGAGQVEISDVLDVAEDNPNATIVADLNHADHVQSDTFDCIIFTQTLQLIYDTRAAIRTLHRILKPGGVVLATFPGISQAKGGDWYWRFTPQSARRLFEEVFSGSNVEVETHGNVLAAISFLHGLAVEELRHQELDRVRPGYDVSITLRAVKAEATL
jgi:SAM-dependent methyltransferase